MTKHVRIENADTSPYKVVVEVWQKFGDDRPDEIVETINLDYPTQMTGSNVYIHSHRYLVVKEG